MQSVYILQNNSYYDVLLNSIMKSKKNISIAIFSFNVSDEEDHKLEVRNLTKLLCQKKQEGVEIKVLLGNSYKINKSEQFKSLDYLNEIAFTILSSFGIQVAFFNHYEQVSLHSKYVILDDELVFMGSHHFSPRAFGIGNDDSISILDFKLATRLKAVFNTDWKYSVVPSNSDIVDFDNRFFRLNNVEKRVYDVPMISDNMVCHLLLNKEYFNSVLNEIDNAKYSINVSMFYFSHSKDKSAITSKLFDAISSAHKRGVKIRFILDRDKPSDIYKSYKANKQRFYDLKGLGILVKYDKKESASHSKLIIIDDEKTIIGSHNWTYGSFEKYQDISVLIESKKLAESFVKIFSSRFDALD